ncbi:nuclear factor related to kappa-B-binding protein [Cylas formicarius]|uniref:nuclear factor related to kappa-B-binding protein n=1 Tax=Cylas formicarius TaxID=197179 RepID=UPI0029587893|nr:nuclear factor related to kappa-B-binding protein [Cylas formicarius]
MADNTTSEDSSSSDYSTDSSDEDGMETAQVGGVKLQLPQGLCEKKDVFDEVFTVELWNSFSDEDKQHLQTFLPNFPENDELEKTKTLQRLFDFDNFRFGNPLNKFHENLKAGYYRPDIARMRKVICKAEKREAKYRYSSFREQLKNEVIESQEKLLNQIRNLPPGVEPKQEKRKVSVNYVSHRTKRRYFQSLASIRSKTDDTDCSSDENYPEGPPPGLSRKQKRHLNGIRNSFTGSKEKMFASTMVAKLNGFCVDLEKYITPHHNPFYINDELYKNLLYQHKKRKLEYLDDPEFNTKGITISDIINRTQLPYIKNLPHKPIHSDVKPVSKKRVKRESLPYRKSPENVATVKSANTTYNHSSNSDSDSDSTIDAITVPSNQSKKLKPNKNAVGTRTSVTKLKIEEIKTEPLDYIQKVTPPPTIQYNSMPSGTLAATPSNSIKTIGPITPPYGKITPIKMEELETIDIMNTPIELDSSEIDIMEFSVKPELMQETHANFFSLIRDVICSTNEHRMNMYTLQERLKSWQENPISPLNDWYSFTDNWISILPSAITFLCGNASEQPDDFVPYMEYKISLDVYQWIGAGRDSDQLLSSLCNFWLEHRSESKLLSPTDMDIDVVDRDSTPPPPRCPTNWTVRKATTDEINEYREQERRRYDNPHKAFTYRCNGYESVVGPIKGIYSPAVGNAKARGHTMLNANRPNFVTILSLVRDATARLPNGEGTRADICELLKSSQYISSSAPDNVLQSVVSGALDRMHTQWDPCVRYDQKRKIWIYLHRHRTEDDFERIHQQYQGIQKTKKPTRKSPAKPKSAKSDKQVKHKPSPQNVDANGPTPAVTLTEPSQKPKAVRRQSVLQNQAREEKTVTVAVPNLVATAQKSTSLLLSNNPPSVQQEVQGEPSPNSTATKSLIKQPIKAEMVDTDLTETLQIRVASPNILKSMTKGQMMKIVSPSQGKSLIIPTSNPQIIKQIKERPVKQAGQLSNQQFLQSVALHQKQQQKSALNKSTCELSLSEPIKTVEKTKVPVSVQQQIIQRLTPQQLQNMKNVTLLRANSSGPSVSLTPISSPLATESQQNLQNIVTVAVSKQTAQNELGASGVQIKTPGNLTPSQTQQILQTIKQKYLPNANILTQQQQVVLKQKGAGLVQLQKTGLKTSPESTTKVVSGSQGPVVAKVLTNAAGQVISVESLLAHQKAHGSLPQGTTLRVQGTKSGHQNIIHLTSTTKPSTIAQFTVGNQNNLVALTTQPKLVAASYATTATVTSTVTTTTTTTTTKAHSRSSLSSRTQQISKLPGKVAQQLINAKIITSDGQKIVQPKVIVGQQPKSSHAKTKGLATNAGAIRMVNAANLNLTTIGGKPVLLASKSGTIQNLHGQNVILQAQPVSSGGQLVLQSPVVTTKSSMASSVANLNVLNQSGNIVFGQQVKSGQLPQQVVFANAKTNTSPGGGASSSQSPNISQSHIVLGGQQIRLQTSNATSGQRVVLASQGQGGQIVAQQILLPAGFQGTAINIKALQGVKVIPIAQAQGKGSQNRQMFARVMSPNLVKQTNQTSTNKVQETVTIHSPGSE